MNDAFDFEDFLPVNPLWLFCGGFILVIIAIATGGYIGSMCSMQSIIIESAWTEFNSQLPYYAAFGVASSLIGVVLMGISLKMDWGFPD